MIAYRGASLILTTLGGLNSYFQRRRTDVRDNDDRYLALPTGVRDTVQVEWAL